MLKVSFLDENKKVLRAIKRDFGLKTVRLSIK